MHLYFGVAEIVDYSLNHFSGTHGMSPSEMLCCSVLSSINLGIWPSVSSFTQGEKKICFPSLLKTLAITILTDPHMDLNSKTQHQCFSPFLRDNYYPI